MSDKSSAERAEYVFKASELVDGTPWIWLELLRSPELSILREGILGIDLHEGATFKDAERLALVLNETVKGLSYTKIDAWAVPREKAGDNLN